MIENYAVVERLRIRFHKGFNVLSGETGSGKSIVVDALGLLLGERASADMLRTGADKARVSGIFEAPKTAADLLANAGIDSEGDELIIDREILAGVNPEHGYPAGRLQQLYFETWRRIWAIFMASMISRVCFPRRPNSQLSMNSPA